MTPWKAQKAIFASSVKEAPWWPWAAGGRCVIGWRELSLMIQQYPLMWSRYCIQNAMKRSILSEHWRMLSSRMTIPYKSRQVPKVESYCDCMGACYCVLAAVFNDLIVLWMVTSASSSLRQLSFARQMGYTVSRSSVLLMLSIWPLLAYLCCLFEPARFLWFVPRWIYIWKPFLSPRYSTSHHFLYLYCFIGE